MNEINEIKLPEGVNRIAVKQHDDKIVIKLIPEEPKFKRGDILISIVTPGLTVIFDKITSTTTFDSIYHNGESSNHYWSLESSNHYWSLKTFRHATEKEKQKFFDELKADGKRWNAEKLEIEDISQYKFKAGDAVRIKHGVSSKTHRYALFSFVEDMDEYIGKKLIIDSVENIYGSCRYRIRGWYYDEDWLEPWSEKPKNGDLAIFWDNYCRNHLIRLYDTKSRNMHLDNHGSPWDNAVKWDGTKEQFKKVLRGEI